MMTEDKILLPLFCVAQNVNLSKSNGNSMLTFRHRSFDAELHSPSFIADDVTKMVQLCATLAKRLEEIENVLQNYSAVYVAGPAVTWPGEYADPITRPKVYKDVELTLPLQYFSAASITALDTRLVLSNGSICVMFVGKVDEKITIYCLERVATTESVSYKNALINGYAKFLEKAKETHDLFIEKFRILHYLGVASFERIFFVALAVKYENVMLTFEEFVAELSAKKSLPPPALQIFQLPKLN